MTPGADETRSARHESVRDGGDAAGAAPAAGPDAKGPSRAGRNLGAAVAVGVGLGAVVLASLFVRQEAFLVVVSAAVLVAVREMHQALSHAQLAVPVVPVAVGSVSMVVGAYVRGADALTVTFGLTVVAVLLWRASEGVHGAVPDISAGVLVALYPCFLAGFASLMLAAPDGSWRIVTFILVTICSDIGGYVAGVFFGRHPMAPSVSPKKSWEGFTGSVLACATAGAVSLPLFLDGAWWAGALLGAVVATGATVGDLMESTIKRDLGIKDMGNVLPGHGGIMDRLDSLLITAPLVWATFALVLRAA